VHLDQELVQNKKVPPDHFRVAMRKRVFRICASILLAVVLHAQSPEVKDQLGRNTPQESIFHFLEACHAHDYQKAMLYFDLRGMSREDRAKNGLQLARQLEDLLDDTEFTITTLSRDTEGDQSDGIPPNRERLATFHVNKQTLDLQLERVELKPGLRVWLVSADSIPMIPTAHQLVAETPFEKKLPQQLVTFEIFDTPVWRWIALAIMAVVIWIIAGFLSWGLVRVVRPLVDAPGLRGPLRVCLAVIAFRMAMELASPATLPRLYLQRALGMIFFLAIAWGAAVVVDLAAARWHSTLDPRVQAISYSVLPLGRQILKLTLFLIAILSVLGAWGYNTSTILAGLGVGGLAVALAAQKTIENLFGGISVIGDRPVLVGDVCRFGDHVGTVIHIGLRSTRLRTPDRTVISVPNGQFSSMALENISGRDKFWFHPVINLRRDTTSDQLSQVLSSFREILGKQPKMEPGKIPVRFIGIGTYSFDVEINAYVNTSDNDEFLALQQELLIQMLQAVEKAGTALAVPWQASVEPQTAPEDGHDDK
jgi:MscS family membrane protein